jgi:putative ABC transport system permease protein
MSSWMTRAARRIRAVVQHDRIDAELDEEVRMHLAMETEDIARRSGVSTEEARRRALVAFGGVSRYQEDHRDARAVRWFQDTMQDVRYAARSLGRSGGFTLSSVLVLALGIGSTTAVFSAVDSVLLDPTHERLAVIVLRKFPSLSTADFRAIEQQQRSFSAVGALRRRDAAFSAGGEPQQLRVGAATSGFFRALGVRPVRGRSIEPADERVGAPPVTLVSHALAVRALGGEAAALGRSVTIDGTAHTVVGVLPVGVTELIGARGDVWPVLQLAPPERRGPFGMLVIARLRPGATFESATRDLAGINDRVAAQWGSGKNPDPTLALTPVPFRKAFLADASKMLRVFGAAVGLVLLIAVANVASLMLVRAVGRSRELSLRTVLGATRTRLVRLFVTESIVLAAVGAVAGIVMGVLGLRALIALGPRMPGLSAAHLDLRAMGFAVAVALLAGLVVGAYPVALLLRSQASGGAQDGSRTAGAGRQTHAVRSAFVVAQFALALPLLAVAALLLTSFIRLQRVDPGFDPERILTVRVSLPAARYRDDSAIAGYWARALPRVREVPGVREVGLGSALPPNENGGADDNFNLLDRPVPKGASEPNSPMPSVSPEYFTTLGVRLLEGRMFTPLDTANVPPVTLVSRSWVRQYFPDAPAVGRKFIRGGCTECPPSTIIGVVDDVRYSGLNGPADAVYSPLTEGWSRALTVFIRTTAPPAEVTERVRAAIRSVDPTVPLDDAAPMVDRLNASIAEPRHWMTLLGAFAVAALVLAGVGIFGMLSYTVSTRRREIGVRMALGARRQAVVRLIVGRGLLHATIGALLGLGAALVATRSIATVLFGVSPHDPMALAAVTVVLLGVALIACWLPAHRAAAIDPMDAIRMD